MNDDLISRQAAIDALMLKQEKTDTPYGHIISLIRDLPSAQPERKKGKWIAEKIIYSIDYPTLYICHCSECGWGISAAESTGWAKFCPSCGSKMEEPE